MDNFDFLGPNLPKNGFWDQNFKNLSLDSESASLRCYVHQFSDKFAQKWILGSEFQKSKSGFGISILEILCAPIFRQNGQLWIFLPKFAQKWFLGSKFQKSKSGFGISILEILGAPIFRQNGQLWIFGPKFAQKWILGSKFQKSKSGFGINTSNIPCVPIFSQNGQFLIFRPKFGEIAQLRAIFWFKYCWECCRDLGGSWNKLDEGGWSWVEVGARFGNTISKNIASTCFYTVFFVCK